MAETSVTPAGRRFSTGNENLDRLLGGGIPVGDLVALTAPPESQSELFFRELAAARRMLYVDTSGAPEGELAERFPTERTEVVAASPAELLTDPRTVVDEIPPESFVVVDAVNGLEAAPDDQPYRAFLNALKRRVRGTDSVAFLHCLTGEGTSPTRTATLHRADDVWQLRPNFDNRTIKYQLLVTKARFNRALDEPVPLLLTDSVDIDTSWSI